MPQALLLPEGLAAAPCLACPGSWKLLQLLQLLLLMVDPHRWSLRLLRAELILRLLFLLQSSCAPW